MAGKRQGTILGHAKGGKQRSTAVPGRPTRMARSLASTKLRDQLVALNTLLNLSEFQALFVLHLL